MDNAEIARWVNVLHYRSMQAIEQVAAKLPMATNWSAFFLTPTGSSACTQVTSIGINSRNQLKSEGYRFVYWKF